MSRRWLPLLVFLFAAPAAQAMRCDTLLVKPGDRDFQVRERCGEPFWTDRYAALEVIGADGPLEQQHRIDFDVWYYNFGPRQFMRRLVFRDGRLERDETLGYGVARIGADCGPAALVPRLRAGEVIARCGEPAMRRGKRETWVTRPVRGLETWQDRRREEWIYDFGEGRFLRQLRLVDGVVEAVESIPR